MLMVWPAMLALARDYLDKLRADERFSGNFAPCLQALAAHLDEAARRIDRLG
ncbi:hypothetical protein [Malikia spinosa]|uniref:hypothetical protein n=1 Tax=Malikia spinosa TaxID=86180 RepID=UPI001474FC7E|nr:hypothetical protein [Malikia spinosa]